MPPTIETFTVSDHFTGRVPAVTGIYEAILKASRALGPVTEEAKKTSIHLVRTTSFAGVATRKAALILTLKSDRDIRSSRVDRHEKVSANRWHLEIRLESPAQVDRELVGWLRKAYELAG